MKELQRSIADLLRLKTDTKVERKVKSQKRTIGGKLVRFNRHGKAFFVENYKYGIHGPPTKEERLIIEEEWQKIKPE